MFSLHFFCFCLIDYELSVLKAQKVPCKPYFLIPITELHQNLSIVEQMCKSWDKSTDIIGCHKILPPSINLHLRYFYITFFGLEKNQHCRYFEISAYNSMSLFSPNLYKICLPNFCHSS